MTIHCDLPHGAGVGKTLLVVEDDDLLGLVAREFLEAEGYSVLVCRNADEALSLIESCPAIRLIFTDIDMSGRLNGLDLAHVVRARSTPIPVIVTSGGAFRQDLLPVSVPYLRKPYRLDHLLEMVQAGLSNK